MSESVEQITEYAFDPEQALEYAKVDMDFFGALICPDDLTLDFPPFYTWLWSVLIEKLDLERDFSKFALGLPRGHGKTMVVKLLIAYAILYSSRKYILVIGATKSRAEAIISDVCDMLDSYNVQQVFGNWRVELEKDTQELKKFSFNGRPVILEAAGWGTAIRGSQQKNARPDLMVFDDAQTKECAESLSEANTFKNWFLGTALKAKSPTGCTYIYIGNMYKDIELVQGSGQYACMLRNLQRSSTWTSFIVGAILQDGTALWEELQPYEQLMAEFQQDLDMGSPEIFYAEVLNDPKTSISFFIDPTKIKRKQIGLHEIPQGSYIVIDPATSKLTPDQFAVGYFEIYDQVPVCVEIHTGKWSGPESVHFVLELAMEKQTTLICVEDVAYQYTLCEWFEFIIEQLGLSGINVATVSGKGNSKNSRILRNFKSLMNGEMMLTEETYSTVVAQAIPFDPTKNNNVDDILDMLSLAESPPLEYSHLMAIAGDLSHFEQQELIDPGSTTVSQLPATLF